MPRLCCSTHHTTSPRRSTTVNAARVLAHPCKTILQGTTAAEAAPAASQPQREGNLLERNPGLVWGLAIAGFIITAMLVAAALLLCHRRLSRKQAAAAATTHRAGVGIAPKASSKEAVPQSPLSIALSGGVYHSATIANSASNPFPPMLNDDRGESVLMTASRKLAAKDGGVGHSASSHTAELAAFSAGCDAAEAGKGQVSFNNPLAMAGMSDD